MGTHWEHKKSTSPPASKRKNLGPSWAGIFEVANFFHLAFFFQKSVKYSLFSEKSPQSNNFIKKIIMFSHIVQQIAMI
jgi:hypothetical protein